MKLSYLLLAIPALCFAEEPQESPEDLQLLAACNSDRGVDNVEDVKDAIAKGANINVQGGGSGQTPLMAAVLRGKESIVKYLLSEGADTTIPEMGGYTPPHGAGFQGRAGTMKLLIDHGIDVNEAHEDGYVPFHRACWGHEERHAELVQLLLEHGVDPDIPTEDGRTCLDMTQNADTINVINEWKNKKAEL